ncbi:leucine-rich repeat domain-containing protein [Rivihabitans pingtungensis]|uniref:Internalin A n=1 Tax=Rivihabitans pingtungensis TaxID=1054498 RepID=A0A318KQH2_9NEIS|nr:leucine-rich repeat domain-containing protein [Rivihabitans pingtungensis]PXX73663.1 internalin A [Rivihabitans pingtungensis]
MLPLNHYIEHEAERLIAEAVANHATELVFDSLRLEILPASLRQLPRLEKLSLKRCRQLRDITQIAALTQLEELELAGCEALADFRPIEGLKALRGLDLSHCRQLTKLTGLAQLTGLRRLDLSGCEQVSDLVPLAQLTRLQQLGLSGCEISDLTPLAQFSNLQQLDLSRCEQISDLTALAQLTSLQQLDLRGCKQVSDLTLFAQLSGLQQLGLSECRQISDLTPLAQLSGLQQLNLSGCEQISDLTALAQLSSLQQLDLSRCEQISDLTSLAQLSRLQQLNVSECEQISDLTPLAQLSSLQQLDLSKCEQISDLTPLAQISSLQQLNLSWGEQISDLIPLAQLSSLQQLNLSWFRQTNDLTLPRLQQLNLRGSGVHLSDLAALQSVPKLNTLACSFPFTCFPGHSPINQLVYLQSLQADTLLDAPQELAHDHNRDDDSGTACLDRILAWQQDIVATGEASNREVKIFVLGNGRVGKTQICRRLQGLSFDEGVASTHGIHLGRFPLLFDNAGQPTLFGNLWDFGGQDIYLGMHSLFLDERAVYVIVWTPEHENPDAFEENGVPMQNRPLVYWLEYVRSLAGAHAPVMVVQSQCDRVCDEQEAPIPGSHGFTRLQRTACSAKQRDGLERFLPMLKAAARLLQERYGAVRLPQSWVDIADQLRAQRDVGYKTLSWPDYVELCQAAHSQAIPQVSIEYLHRAGQVFWRAELFDQQVVLDQAWALSGIYAVLDRASTLPMIRERDGKFTQDLLNALVWREYSSEEQVLFLSMMQQCGVFFHVSDGVYISPGLLPEYAKVLEQVEKIWCEQAAEARACLEYHFLHEGVLRAVLCAIGEKAGEHAAYWKTGVAYYDGQAKGPVRISVEPLGVDASSARGRIVVEAGGRGAAGVVAHLTESIQQIRIGQAPTVQWEIGEACHDSEDIDFGDILDQHEHQAFAEIQPRAMPSVYVSYAWGGESDATVAALQDALAPWVKVHRDKDVMRTGDSIRQFEEEIGHGLCVIVVLSAKYTQSVDCMRELGFIWERAQRQAEQFAKRIIPVVLEDAGINDLEDRLARVQYWQDKLARLENSARKVGPTDCGQSTTQQLQDIKTFTVHLADALYTFADRVMPRAAALSAAEFEPVVELVKKRCGL